MVELTEILSDTLGSSIKTDRLVSVADATSTVAIREMVLAVKLNVYVRPRMNSVGPDVTTPDASNVHVVLLGSVLKLEDESLNDRLECFSFVEEFRNDSASRSVVSVLWKEIPPLKCAP